MEARLVLGCKIQIRSRLCLSHDAAQHPSVEGLAHVSGLLSLVEFVDVQ
jgi:hypothetical protein